MWQFIIYSSSAVLVSMVTGAAVIFLTSPKHIMYWLVRFDAYRSGMTVKYIGDEHFNYCYGERGTRQEKKTSIVMIHGFTASKDMYITLFRKLPADIHIVALDLPGHGATSDVRKGDKIGIDFLVQHVYKFIKLMKLDKAPFHLVGASLGGAIAGLYTVQYPETVERVSLLCPAMKTPEHSPFTKDVETAILNGIDNMELKDCALLPITPAEAQLMLDAVLYHKKSINKQILKGLVDLRKPKNKYFLELFKALAREDSTNLLETQARKIKVPTQLIWGKHDEVIHYSGSEVLQKQLPNCKQVDIIERCGHSIQLDRPGCLLKSLLVFRGEYTR